MDLLQLIVAQPNTPLLIQVINPVIAYTLTYKYTKLVKPSNYLYSYLVACFLTWFSIGLIVKYWFMIN